MKSLPGDKLSRNSRRDVFIPGRMENGGMGRFFILKVKFSIRVKI